MRLVRQPPSSSLCGQSVVAMVLEVTLDESIALFGKSGKTCTRDLITVLRSRGVTCDSRLTVKRCGRELPRRCVLSLHARPRSIAKGWGHWALLWDGTVYDPADGINPVWHESTAITSYLTLDP